MMRLVAVQARYPQAGVLRQERLILGHVVGGESFQKQSSNLCWRERAWDQLRHGVLARPGGSPRRARSLKRLIPTPARALQPDNPVDRWGGGGRCAVGGVSVLAAAG